MRAAETAAGAMRWLVILCPGCKGLHHIPLEGKGFRIWNGQRHTPSIEGTIRFARPGTSLSGAPAGFLCEFGLKGGFASFTSNCTHKARNQTLQVPDVPE